MERICFIGASLYFKSGPHFDRALYSRKAIRKSWFLFLFVKNGGKI